MNEILKTLRRELLASEKTRYRIGQESGIAQSVLSRFANGTRGLSIELASTLARALDHEIILRPTKRKKTTKGNTR
jgi:transcriptional regulator with XRE-family HTH domain